MPGPLPTVILARRPLTADGRRGPPASWFGGCPALGEMPWPRSPGDGRPLDFVAQIDLADLAAVAGPTGLPDEGTLAAFVATAGEGKGGRVMLLPPGAAQTDPPADKLPPHWSPMSPPEDPAMPEPRLYPRWPMEIVSLGVLPREPEESTAAMAAALAPRFGWSDGGFASREMHEATPLVWHAAQLLASDMRRTRAGLPQRRAEHAAFETASLVRLEAAEREAQASLGIVGRLLGREPAGEAAETLKAARRTGDFAASRRARLDDEAGRLDAFIAELEAWIGGADPWTVMAEADAARLGEELRRARTRFREVRWLGLAPSLPDAQLRTLRAMATGGPEAVAALPPSLRAAIDARALLPQPPPALHLMFGRGVDIQGAAEAHERDVLLLQLVWDMFFGWQFGDVGAYQFWIAPEALSRGDLSGVEVTFEGH